ncbi:MAG: hypothetical protein U0W40_12875 [Acidimicrobiia bacterium]
MSTPTPENKAKLDGHAAAELTFDLDAVMATVDTDCEYEWQPQGLRLTGRDECRRMYAAFLPRWQALERDRGLRFEVRSEFWNDEARIREQVAFIRPEGGGDEVRHDFVVVVLWGATGVRGERTYASEEFHRLMLGDDCFDSLSRG